MSSESKAVAVLYDALAKDYEGKVFEKVHYKALITGWLRETKPARLLDVGCGPGLFWSELPERTEVVGLDLSRKMLAHASRARPSGQYHQHDFHEPIPASWGRFDAILAVGSFEFCRDLPAVLEHLGRAAERGAKVLFTVASRADDGPRSEPVPTEGFSGVFLYFHAEDEVRRAVDQAGFVLTALDRQPGWNYRGREIQYLVARLERRAP